MFKNLRAEMVRANITNETLAKALNLNVSTVSAKLRNVNRLKYIEAKNIQLMFFPNLSTEYLFEIEDEVKENYRG
ncbi:Uncharacterised protein [Clostridioides difficile]|uniref:XRE family transcriptional regulator n=1 Tax=Clostridioides difficile TaxID=1496 RepID=UPI0010B3A148|nr:XRE family transcriptional regulator [Clostridioides difficile]MCE0686652.1 XRE family transcriptional regulator [Clostridioides difficile]MCE0711393.1 XRE family transcriptional regulator [Clostridioides difficile]VIF51746.1 Uncharacterised protein [Clostridioides difficile]VIF56374.1 Uncharacterised protein [Clostridioides difficile]VIF58095.1 Uncharacterised protein [Clostridioides difficile]